jgi:hypothetical protein
MRQPKKHEMTHSTLEWRQVQHGLNRHLTSAKRVRNDPLRVNTVDWEDSKRFKVRSQLQ